MRRSERAWVGLLAGAAAVAGTLQVRSVDFFWHSAAGRWILAHGRVPDHDPFRFTSGGEPWVDHEWLFQMLIATVEWAGGVTALVVARAAVAMALALLVYRQTRASGTAPAPAVALALGALLVVRSRLFLRPEIVTFVGLTLLLALLQRWRRGGGRGTVAAMALLVALWANCHPGALVAPVVAFVYLAGRHLPGGSGEPRRGTSRPGIAWVVGLPVLLFAALALNPYGTDIYLVPWKIRQSLAGLAGVNPDWLPAWRLRAPELWGALAVTVAVALAGARRARLDPATGGVAALLGLLALGSARQAPLFGIAAALFLGETAASWRRRPGRQSALRPAPLVVAGTLAAVVWCLLPAATGPLRPAGAAPRFGVGLQPGLYPEGAVPAIRRAPDLGNLYNDVAFGGYLLWRLYPPRQVFLDTRNELDPALLREVGLARSDGRRWQRLMRRNEIDGALVRYDDRPRRVFDPAASSAPAEMRTANALLFPREEYALVYWDDVAMLFVRRTAARREWLARVEWRYLHPEDWRWSFARAARDPRWRHGLAADLVRATRRAEGSRRLRAILGELEAMGRGRVGATR